MSGRDALLLDDSLAAGDVSRAWAVWSGAVESALADAYRFSGGPLPSRGLVLGRRSASFRVVKLGGRRVRKARGSAADSVDAADVFLYRDSSIAPLLDMRRRFKAVMRCMVPLGFGRFMHLVVLYGFQGADSDAEQLALTEQLFDAALGELGVVARGQPCLIVVGDFNVWNPQKSLAWQKGFWLGSGLISKVLGLWPLVSSLLQLVCVSGVPVVVLVVIL